MESTPPGQLYKDHTGRTLKDRRPPPTGAAHPSVPSQPQQAREESGATRTTTTGQQHDAYQPPRAMGTMVGHHHPRQGKDHICAQRQRNSSQPRGGKTTSGIWRPNTPPDHNVDSAQRITDAPQRDARRGPGGVEDESPQGHHRQPALRCTALAHTSFARACRTGHAQGNQPRDTATPKGLPGGTIQEGATFPTPAAGRGRTPPRDLLPPHRRAASAAGYEGTGECAVEPLHLLHSARGRSAYNTA